jgi:dolichol-phosphate mannosyltransferase
VGNKSEVTKANTVILIPTYNEAPNIERQLHALAEFRATRIASNTFDVIVIDDKSPDNTAGLVKDLQFPWVRIESPSEKAGLGNAYKHGFAIAMREGYEFVVEMDADGSHRIDDLAAILDADTKFDLVIGSRWIKGGRVENWSLPRRVLSRCGNIYSKTLLRFPVNDSTSGYRRISTSVLRKLDLQTIASAGYGFQIEMAFSIYKAGGTIIEVPICFVERIAGYSKMSSGIAREAIVNITKLALRSSR